MQILRRFAGPAIGFIVATGLQISGIEALPIAIALWGIAALWGLLAFVTWAPIAQWLPAITVAWPALQRQQSLQQAEELSAETVLSPGGRVSVTEDLDGNYLRLKVTNIGH